MNAATAFLDRHRGRPSLERFGTSSSLSCVLATPRFRASAHVIFFIIPHGSTQPVLVLKAGRGSGDFAASLAREADNLRAVQRVRPGGFDSIPRLLAFEVHAGTPLLLETVVPGTVLKPRVVRRHSRHTIEGLLRWLLDLQTASARPTSEPRADLHRLLDSRLDRITAGVAPLIPHSLVARTRELTQPLASMDFPLVFEHGDLSSPNILRTSEGDFGIVDWELAEPRGLPGQDLFFLLAYLAFAKSGATRVEEHVAAFHRAFFGDSAWARPHVTRYADAIGLDQESIPPLFIACWARYAMGLSERMAHLPGGGGVTDEEARWLTRNRYFALWRHAVEHASDLRLLPVDARSRGAGAASSLPVLEC